MTTTYLAFEVSEERPGVFTAKITEKFIDDIADQYVLIKVKYSSLNFKDALSAKGNKGVTKMYPHVPGVDAAGTVELSKSDLWAPGDEVIVTGFDLGMNTDGGFGEYIIVPENWILRRPEMLTAREAMIYGTAGFTAGLSVQVLINNGITPDRGPIAVTGSTGGVGSLAVAILAKLGYHVAAISSKTDAEPFLTSLGAGEIVTISNFEDTSGKALLKPRFAAAIDTVGGNILGTILKTLDYGGVVTTCGMVGGDVLTTSVFPFILRGIQLIGIDSVKIPIEKRLSVWNFLSNDWKPEQLSELTQEITLGGLAEKIDTIYRGQIKGRIVVAL